MNESTSGAAISLLPVLPCALAFVALQRRLPPPRAALPLLLVAALAVRMLFLAWFPLAAGDLAYDAESFRIVGALVRSGTDVYAETSRHPYLPFQMYALGLGSWLADNTGRSFFWWVRWPSIFADLGITAIVYSAALRLGRGKCEAFWLACIWVFHPVSIYTSTIHGQFDSVAVCFALWSWYLVRFWHGWRSAAFAGLALGFAILDKTWPLILLPPLVMAVPQARLRPAFLAGVFAVPLAALALYAVIFGTTLDLIRLRVVGYDAVPDRYGFTYAFAHYFLFVPHAWLPYFQDHGRDIFLVSIAVVAAVVVPRRDALTSCVTILVAFLVFAHGWGSQYLVWIVPFALLAQRRAMFATYSIAATASLLVYYWGTCGYTCPGALSGVWMYWEFQWIWPLAMVWLTRELVGALRTKREPAAPSAQPSPAIEQGPPARLHPPAAA